MDGLTRLVRAALAVVRAADVQPTSRRQGRCRPPRVGLTGRHGAHPPRQERAGGRGVTAARAGVRVACAERAGPRRIAAGWSLGRSAAPDCRCPFGVPAAGAIRHVIATVWAPQQLRGGSDWGGSGLGVAAGRAGAGQGSARAGQAPLWALAPRVGSLNACYSNDISYYRDTISSMCHGIGPRVLLRVL
jgi:hypothetical protein